MRIATRKMKNTTYVNFIKKKKNIIGSQKSIESMKDKKIRAISQKGEQKSKLGK